MGAVPAVPAARGGARARPPPGSARSMPLAADNTRPRPHCSRAGGLGGPRDRPLRPPGPLRGHGWLGPGGECPQSLPPGGIFGGTHLVSCNIPPRPWCNPAVGGPLAAAAAGLGGQGEFMGPQVGLEGTEEQMWGPQGKFGGTKGRYSHPGTVWAVRKQIRDLRVV